MIHLDGSQGEGGGQVLRTSLGLSLYTGQPFTIDRIRANRSNPGLGRQHLTAVRAAAEIGEADLSGDALRSQWLQFQPRGIKAGSYRFDVGTAGSATLVLQTILPALLHADAASTVDLGGGTHNPHAPPFDFLQQCFLPLVGRMGPEVVAELRQPGFYPAGGGSFRVTVKPVPELRPIELLERGPIHRRRAVARVSALPDHIARRELEVVQERLGWSRDELKQESVRDPRGPGNYLGLIVCSHHVTEVVSGFGRKGVRAERVAARACKEMKRYLDADVPVGEHLADQLLLLVALAGGGRFRTVKPTLHTRTQVDIIGEFLDVDVDISPIDEAVWEIAVS